MLTFKEIRSRSVLLTLKRPIKAKIAYIKEWPILIIDLYTNEGIVGRSYLQPYIEKSLKYISSIIDDLLHGAERSISFPSKETVEDPVSCTAKYSMRFSASSIMSFQSA